MPTTAKKVARLPRRYRYEILPAMIGWNVTADGEKIDWYLLKANAIRQTAKHLNFLWQTGQHRSELLIKGRDGRIQDARTYGDDPKRSKG